MLKREPFINIQLSLHIFFHMCEKRSIQGKLMQKKQSSLEFPSKLYFLAFFAELKRCFDMQSTAS